MGACIDELLAIIAQQMICSCSRIIEAVARKCSVKKAFLEIFQNPEEKTCAGNSFVGLQRN